MKESKSLLKTTVFLSVAVFVLVIGVMLFMLQRHNAPTVESQTTTAPAAQITRTACPEVRFQDFSLDCLGNDAATPNSNAYTVVNVWAWWCEPCRFELPLFDDLRDRHPEWTVVGVHADASESNGAALLQDMDLIFPSYQDPRGLFAAHYSLPPVVPVTVVLDSQGKQLGIAATSFRNYKDLEEAVSDIIAKSQT